MLNFERHRAAQELRQANLRLAAEGERLRQLFVQAPSFMCVLRGPEHVFELTNVTYMQLVGPREIVGKPVREAFPELMDQGFFQLLDTVYATGRPFVAHAMPLKLQSLDEPGTIDERFLDFVYQPIVDGAGLTTGIFVVGSDVTAATRTQAELRELNETLEARAVERTKALMAAEEALRHAQKMEAVGQLTSGLAHDFNNLLTSIVGNLELLDDHVAAERPRQWIAAALASAVRGTKLTAQLLAFARKQHLVFSDVDLNAAVKGIQDLIVRTLPDDVEVNLSLADGLWLAAADVTQVEVSLLNLLINARDAMPRGGRVTISTRNLAPGESRPAEVAPGDYVAIEVSDTGEGMTPEVLARALEPFFTTKGVGKGTGLGLSQVYGFVRQCGGAMRLRSPPSRGTTVEIFFPRAVPSQSDAGHPVVGRRPT